MQRSTLIDQVKAVHVAELVSVLFKVNVKTPEIAGLWIEDDGVDERCGVWLTLGPSRSASSLDGAGLEDVDALLDDVEVD